MSPHPCLHHRARLARLVAALMCAAPVLTLTLVAAPADAAGVNLHRGSHGASVRLLESRLNRLGLLVRSAVDRSYRQATTNSVKRFQRQHHIRVTGRVNRPVWNMVAHAVALRVHRPLPPAPSIIGHRGAMRPGLSENTLASLRYAHGWADVLEFDLRLTADHEIVLMHDATLDRTTNCSGQLTSWTLADLRSQCRVGGQPIPTFAEVAAYAATVSESIAPELKNTTFSDADITKVLDLIDQYGLAGRTYMQSFTPAVLGRVHALKPGLKLVLASTHPPSVRLVKGFGATRVAVQLENLNAGWVARYKRAGLKIWTFTALNRAGLVGARALRVTAVVTDIPRQAVNVYH
jgi:glycerophosphoryl diester phosphodiesterase